MTYTQKDYDDFKRHCDRLPSPYNRQLIDEVMRRDEFMPDARDTPIALMILFAFDWTGSVCGFHYWSNLYNYFDELNM